MPFLSRMIHKENYELATFYSGLPATTPAVQGELYYNVRCAVPSFGFLDRQRVEPDVGPGGAGVGEEAELVIEAVDVEQVALDAAILLPRGDLGAGGADVVSGNSVVDTRVPALTLAATSRGGPVAGRPLARPYSALKLFVCTLNSETASGLSWMAWFE